MMINDDFKNFFGRNRERIITRFGIRTIVVDLTLLSGIFEVCPKSNVLNYCRGTALSLFLPPSHAPV